MHMSRFSEELILWSSQQFAFVDISADIDRTVALAQQGLADWAAHLQRAQAPASQ